MSQVTIPDLYKDKMVNYSGKTSDTNERYADIITDTLLKNITIFDSIECVPRKNSYKIDSHDGTIKNLKSNRVEEKIALNLYKKNFDDPGIFIDYQVPLKNSKNNRLGKIDLVSLKDNTYTIIELKKGGNKESLLRCALEIMTYYQRLDKKKYIEDLKEFRGEKVEMGILVSRGGIQYKEFIDSRLLRQLIELKKIKLYVFESENEKITNIEQVNK